MVGAMARTAGPRPSSGHRTARGAYGGSRVARAHRWPRLMSRQVTDSGLVGTASAATIVKLWPSTHSVCKRAAPASAPRLARLPEPKDRSVWHCWRCRRLPQRVR